VKSATRRMKANKSAHDVAFLFKFQGAILGTFSFIEQHFS
jgi:hypothetical protein